MRYDAKETEPGVLGTGPRLNTKGQKMDNVIAIALFESFKEWGSKDPQYKKLYKKLNETSFDIVTSAFDELEIHKPGQYDFWWANQHMRWIKKISNEQTRLVHELMYQFLTRYARGQLEKRRPTKEKNKRAQATRAVV